MFLRFRKFFVAALLPLFPLFAGAETLPVKPNLSNLMRDLQKVDQTPEQLKLILWLPDDFWTSVISNKANADDAVKVLSPYVIVAVLDAKVSPFGAFTYTPESDMRRGIRIFDAAGNTYAPLEEKDFTSDLKIVIGSMRPILATALGDMGKNMAFMVFPRQGSNGKRIAVATETGSFHVRFADKDFNYRLPLESLSPQVKCVNDPELFPISYKFCPYDGTPTVTP